MLAQVFLLTEDEISLQNKLLTLLYCNPLLKLCSCIHMMHVTDLYYFVHEDPFCSEQIAWLTSPLLCQYSPLPLYLCRICGRLALLTH